MTVTGGARARIPTLNKMVQLLRAFSPEAPSWRLLELSRHLGWDGASTHRFLRALVEVEMLEVDDDLTYRIGTLPLELAAVAASAQPAWSNLLRRLPEVAERTTLTTQVGVLDGSCVSIVASHESPSALKAAARLGERLPLHATAGGKAILAQLSDEDVERLLPVALPRYTEHTITDRDRMLSQLQEIRATRIAYVDSELSLGLSAVATAVPAKWISTTPAALVCAGLSRSVVPDLWRDAERILLDFASSLGASDATLRAAMALPQVQGVNP